MIDSLLADTVGWFNRHHYSCTTNESSNEIKLAAYFSSPAVTNTAYYCSLTPNRASGVVTLTASARGALASVRFPEFLVLLAIHNSFQDWGHFGFDLDGDQLFFKVSLYRSSGRIKPEELDRLLENALKAMDSGLEWLTPLKQEDGEEETPAEEDRRPTNVAA